MIDKMNKTMVGEFVIDTDLVDECFDYLDANKNISKNTPQIACINCLRLNGHRWEVLSEDEAHAIVTEWRELAA